MTDPTMNDPVAAPASPAPAPAPAPVGAATAFVQPNLSPDAAQAEIRHLKNGADSEFLSAFINSAHPGHRAAIDRMSHLHTLAAGEVATAEDAAPAAQASTPTRDEAGRFAPTPETAPDPTPYRGLIVTTLDTNTSPADAVAVAEAIHHAAAATAVPADMAAAGLKMIEADVAQRQGRRMSADELGQFEVELARRVGAENVGAAADKLEAAIKRAGKRGELLRQSLASSSPFTAAWCASTIYFESR